MYYWYDSEKNSFVLDTKPNESVIPQLIWVITDKCKYSCPFCFQPKTGSEVNISDVDTVISIFNALGVQKIDISGGEPLHFKNLPALVNKLNHHNIGLTISTNGSGSIGNRLWLTNNWDVFSRIIVSINAPDEKSNDRLCGAQGAFENLYNLITLLKKQKCDNIRINTVLTNMYIRAPENLQQIINLVKEISPREWCLIEPHPENKLETFDEYKINNHSFKKILGVINGQFDNLNIKIISRSVENYSGYWVLNPDNRIILHTDGIRNPISVDFSISSVKKIESLSKYYGLWLPTHNN